MRTLLRTLSTIGRAVLRVLNSTYPLFRIRGILLSLHFSFFLLLAYVGFEGWRLFGWAGLGWSEALVVSFFTCVVLHELGHCFTARAFGVGVPRILLLPIGGMAEFDRMPRRPREEFLIAIAGPTVNFAIAGLLYVMVGLPQDWSFWSLENYPDTVRGSLQLLLHWNIWMGCFNLIPVFPMDGGRVLRALLAVRMPYLRATFIAATLGKVLAIVAIWMALTVFETSLTAILFAFIFLAGEAEYRAVRRREREDVHWRSVLARHAAQADEMQRSMATSAPLVALPKPEAVPPPGDERSSGS